MFDDVESGRLPAGLDGMVPGPGLGELLATVDLSVLSGFDRVVVLRAHQRLASHHQAKVCEAMASISDLMNDLDDDVELASEAAAAEIRAALCLTRRAADFELGFAVELVGRVPAVWVALRNGLIDLRRARVLVSGTSHLPVDTARVVVERIIDRACRLTTGQIAAVLRRLCVEADPEEATSRYRQAHEERRVIMEPTVEGTSNLLGLDLPPDRVEAILGRIGLLARNLKTGGETRTLDQLRADVFLDLLEGTQTGQNTRRGVVDIRVDLPPWPVWERLRGSWEGLGRSSPISPVRSPNGNKVRSGGGPSPTPPPDSRLLMASPGGDPPPVNDAKSRPATPPVSSPDVGCPPQPAISTIASPGPKADPPGSIISSPPAATTIGSATRQDGNTNPSPAATTSGPAASATNTPPAAGRPRPAGSGSIKHRNLLRFD